MSRVQVAIVGAGAAGLMAARELVRRGKHVVVLEARDRIGGRIWTRRSPGLVLPIELGAEFVHGEAPLTMRLLEEAGLAALEVQGRSWRFRAGHLERNVEPWRPIDRALARIDGEAPDRTLERFLAEGRGGRRAGIERKEARRFVEGFHGADPTIVSVRSIAPEEGEPVTSNARRVARVAQGYGALLEHLTLEIGGSIRLRSEVRAILWRRGRAVLHLRGRGAGARLEADAVILTVPPAVLSAPEGVPGRIAFDPDPSRARAALARLAPSCVIRLVLWFHEPPWTLGSRGAPDEEASHLGFLHVADGPFQVFWTAHPARAPLAVAWSGGPAASSLSRGGARGVRSAALATLAKILGTRHRRLAARLRGSWMHDWARDSFTRAAYGYVRVGGGEPGHDLARPIESTLFFAGEATDEASGTVEGALASGLAAAGRVTRALSRRRRVSSS